MTRTADRKWLRFVATFLFVFCGTLAATSAFIVLVDPFGTLPFSLALDRPIFGAAQRHIYPHLLRSGRFDSVILGTSTSRLVDPLTLNAPFSARFFNAALDNGMAWEQKLLFDQFLSKVPRPKIVLVGLDTVWCRENADHDRFGRPNFPYWLYDESPWNDLSYMLNSKMLELAWRVVRYQFGGSRAQIRDDGFGVFTPPESKYDLKRARYNVWRGRDPTPPVVPPVTLTEAEKMSARFPALDWLDEMMAKLPSVTVKVFAYMPVHIAAQPTPGSLGAAVEAECKDRISAIARRRGVHVLDWRIHSAITRDESNYWDALHYRLPIAGRVAQGVIDAVVFGRDGSLDRDHLYTPP